MIKPEEINWIFFGTSNFSVTVLDELKNNGYKPSLVVTVEDKPKGRKMLMTPPETKIWAEKENIKCIQLKTLRNKESIENIKSYAGNGFDLFVVASYGKIIPQEILDLPKYKTLNVHPSLLPKLRGASPLQSAILEEDKTGVSIIRLDAEEDHGPIIAQKNIDIEWPPYEDELEKVSGVVGGKLLAEVIPDWMDGKIKEAEQDHPLATFCKKIEKTDGEINLSDDPEKNLRKIRAYCVWPTAYFFEDDTKKRIVIKRAHIETGKLILDRVIPEGKKEMNYSDYLRGKKLV
ncbi:MAG: methionyl-tRNA formyltransferase [Nitrospira sp.]